MHSGLLAPLSDEVWHRSRPPRVSHLVPNTLPQITAVALRARRWPRVCRQLLPLLSARSLLGRVSAEAEQHFPFPTDRPCTAVPQQVLPRLRTRSAGAGTGPEELLPQQVTVALCNGSAARCTAGKSWCLPFLSASRARLQPQFNFKIPQAAAPAWWLLPLPWERWPKERTDKFPVLTASASLFQTTEILSLA